MNGNGIDKKLRELSSVQGTNNESRKQQLRDKEPQILELISEELKSNNLTNEERKKLEETKSVLAGYLLSFWFPRSIIKKIFMFFFLIIGVIGTFQWSPWFCIFILIGLSFSPRIVGESLRLIGKFSR